MSTPPKTEMKPTLGLTGLTINAMALIAPGAFLWLTYEEQALYGAPSAGSAMWLGIVFALVLCFATAISYSELSKLYPGAGSSYLYAEQAFLSKSKAFKWARLIKFFTGWNSHLYYWVYTGLMVGVTAILAGWLAGQLWPDTFSGTYNSPLFMWLFCVVFSLGVGYIAYRGVNGTTAVNMAINIIQISALVVFSIMAIAYRTSHHDGSLWLSPFQRHTGQLQRRPGQPDRRQQQTSPGNLGEWRSQVRPGEWQGRQKPARLEHR